MCAIELQYPLGSYSVDNPPSNETLKGDLGTIQVAVNAGEDAIGAVAVSVSEIPITPASASVPASLDLHEDTDNGTNKITIIAPSAVASDKVLTLPDETGTLISSISSQLLTGWIPVSDSWAYASADAPTFTITVPSGAASLYSVGMRIKLTQTTVKYFIITEVADTVLTVYGGTDYTLVDAAISAISYSTQKAPLGFPISPTKWSLSSYAGSGSQNTPVANTIYNLGGSLLLPIGAWELEFNASAAIYATMTAAFTAHVGLSTANNSFSDTDLAISNAVGGRDVAGTAELRHYATVAGKKFIDLAAKATYYLNIQTPTASVATINITDGNIIAKCAYL